MTDERDDKDNDDVDWLRDAFERANRGDNGTVSDAERPAFNPFATGPMEPLPRDVASPPPPPVEPAPPAPREDAPRRHDLDLDFETENMPPVTEFEPITRLEDVVRSPGPVDPPTEALDALEIPDAVNPIPEPTPPTIPRAARPDSPPLPIDDRTDTSNIGRIGELFGGLEPQLPTEAMDAVAPRRPVRPSRPERPIRVPRGERSPRPDRSDGTPEERAAARQQLALVGAGVGVVILALAAFLGGRIVGAPAAAPTPSASAEPGAPTVAQPPGTYPFGQLFGGECLNPFDSAWATTFTVVDCATEHPAQLVYAGDLALDGSYPSYPGDQQTADAAMSSCQRKGVLDLGAASIYTDLQISAAYPPSQTAWEAGDTRYYCFATRADGATLSGSLAGKLTTGTTTPTPEPTPTS